MELVLISVAILAQDCKLTEVDLAVYADFKSMQPATKPDAKKYKSVPAAKPKGTVATALTAGPKFACISVLWFGCQLSPCTSVSR